MKLHFKCCIHNIATNSIEYNIPCGVDEKIKNHSQFCTTNVQDVTCSECLQSNQVKLFHLHKIGIISDDELRSLGYERFSSSARQLLSCRSINDKHGINHNALQFFKNERKQ